MNSYSTHHQHVFHWQFILVKNGGQHLQHMKDAAAFNKRPTLTTTACAYIYKQLASGLLTGSLYKNKTKHSPSKTQSHIVVISSSISLFNDTKSLSLSLHSRARERWTPWFSSVGKIGKLPSESSERPDDCAEACWEPSSPAEPARWPRSAFTKSRASHRAEPAITDGG